MVYTRVFGGVIVALFMSGLTESLVMGFSGLSRVLITYLQITMAILLSLAWCFLGIGMLVTTLARTSDVATGIAFIIWLSRLLFMGLILLGVLIRQGMSSETVIALALFNPMQVFHLQIELRCAVRVNHYFFAK